MRKKIKRLTLLLLSVLLIAALLPTGALAVGKINTDKAVDLTIRYQDGAKAIPGARFMIYKVADVDAYVHMTLTDDFEPYKGTINGLANLDDLTEEQWLSLASTLRGYVLSDELKPFTEGRTDGNGDLAFSDLPVGLYLVIGNRVTTEDYYTYTSVPFMIFLPALDNENNVWDYETEASPKFTKDHNPPDEDDDYVTRKALKIWDDEGYEDLRPKEIIVQLLCDGKIFETVTLNEDNHWRYAWDNLNADYEWEVIEKKEEGYAVTITRTGITFTIINKYIAPINASLPVQKRITGYKPKAKATFTFTLTANEVTNPMPAESVGLTKEISIRGAGTVDFGEITFTKAGTYAYTVSEKKGSVKGYTYDKSVYTVTYEVTEENGDLSVTKTITDKDGNPVDLIEFKNPYRPPRIPQTGVLWWPVPLLVCAGLTFLTFGLIRRRKYNG